MADLSRPPLVSVIVPVRDRGGECVELLRRLDAQTLPRDRFEVIIGDDGSRPGTLGAIDTADGRARIVSGPQKTSYAARNRAAGSARGAILAFCDSDCLPDPAWLEAGVAALATTDIVAGEVVYIAPSHPTVWTRLTIDMFLDQERNARRRRSVTANLFIRRSDFERWGRFDESLASGGDFEFTGRAVAQGARLSYAAAAVVRHPTMDDAASFLGKVWRTNVWSALRRRASGEPVSLTAMLGLLPIVGGLWSRRQMLRQPGRLAASRFTAAEVTTSAWDEWKALAVFYLVVIQVTSVARVYGWFLSRMRATSGSGRPSGRP